MSIEPIDRDRSEPWAARTAAVERMPTGHAEIEGVVAPILALLAEYLDAGLSFLAHVDGPSLVIDRSHDRAGMGLRSDDVIPLGDTYCQTLLARESASLVVEDALADPHFAALASTRDLGIGAYCGVPLRRADGRLYGTLCTLHRRARAIDAGEIRLLSTAAGIIMRAIEAEERRGVERRRQELDASAQVRFIYTHMAGAVLVLDAGGRVTDGNPAAEELLGLSLERLRGRPLSVPAWEATWPDGTPIAPDDLPVRRAVRTGRPERGVVLRFTRPDGERRFIQVDAVPVVKPGADRQIIVSYVDLTARVAAEEAERAASARFRALTERSTDLISVVAADGVVTYSSPSHQHVLGTMPAAEEGTVLDEIIHPEDLPAVRAARARALATTEPTPPILVRRRAADGTWRWLESVGINLLADPAIRGIVINSRDVTDRVRAEEARRASELRFRSVAQSANEAIVVADGEGRIVSWNRAAAAMFGYREDEVLGRSLALLMPERYRGAHRRGVARQSEAGAAAQLGRMLELEGLRADGTEFPLEISLASWADGASIFCSGSMRDITARKQAEAELRHQALHDALTGLPNRVLLQTRLAEALQGTVGAPLALALLDLDRFKDINDTFGHHHGDALLQQVGTRLHAVLRRGDTVARLGGDEFALLLPATDRAGALQVARLALAALDEPFAVEGQPFRVDASIGLACAPADGTDASALLRHADVAMYAAKREAGGMALYDPATDQNSPDRLALIVALRRAIEHGSLVLHYQPKLDGASGRVTGVEALVRWAHPERGLIPPDQFIALAETNGLIGPLARWVLQAAIEQCQNWRLAGIDLEVAVNLSTWNLHDPQLMPEIGTLLVRHGLAPERLRLEITESSIMADDARTREVVSSLGALGVGLSIDDFGTGYSSLAQLKRLPVDELKIDRSFVRHLTTDEADAAIVRSTIGMAHSVGLRVVAEGVEDETTWDLLAQ